MPTKGNQAHEQRNRITFNAIKVALLLALVCIGINTYVLWNIYGSKNYSTDPTEASVDKLASQMDTQMTRIDQKLLNIELSLNEAREEQPLLGEILPNLEALDKSLAAILDKIDQNQFNTDARVTAIEDLLLAQSNTNGLRPSDSEWVSLVVERGDSIWGLASQFENPPQRQLIDAIMEFNNISDPRRLPVGQELIIPIN